MHKNFLVLLLLATCFSGCQKNKKSADISSKNANMNARQVDVVASGLEVPWAMAFAPDGRMFVTERPGRVRIIEQGKLLKKPLAVLSDVYQEGEAGLLGMALHPQFKDNHWLYLCYTYQGSDGPKERVKRFREQDSVLIEDKIIIDLIPAAKFHDGCRLKFGPDKKLYITTGDATKGDLAQKLDSLAGKTLRLNDDGSVPKDNPFVDKKNARPEIWSYGHRNSQGLDWQPKTGVMFQTEHGPSLFDGPAGGDEVNIVLKGKNYGWPIIHHKMKKEGLESPLLEYTPAIAPAGATFYRSKIIPEWHNNFFFACLKGERIIRVRLDGQKVIETEDLLKDTYGRIRDVIEGPDGSLYFATSNRDTRGSPTPNDDRIMRIR